MKPLEDYELDTIKAIRKQYPRFYFYSKARIRELYRDFSDDCYCAGWQADNAWTIDYFVNWLRTR